MFSKVLTLLKSFRCNFKFEFKINESAKNSENLDLSLFLNVLSRKNINFFLAIGLFFLVFLSIWLKVLENRTKKSFSHIGPFTMGQNHNFLAIFCFVRNCHGLYFMIYCPIKLNISNNIIIPRKYLLYFYLFF